VLRELTGGESGLLDPRAFLEYFTPLEQWLRVQNGREGLEAWKLDDPGRIDPRLHALGQHFNAQRRKSKMHCKYFCTTHHVFFFVNMSSKNPFCYPWNYHIAGARGIQRDIHMIPLGVNAKYFSFNLITHIFLVNLACKIYYAHALTINHLKFIIKSAFIEQMKETSRNNRCLSMVVVAEYSLPWSSASSITSSVLLSLALSAILMKL